MLKYSYMRKIAAVSALSLIFALLGIFSITRPANAQKSDCAYVETRNNQADPTLFDVYFCVDVPRQDSQIKLTVEVTRASGGGVFNFVWDEITGQTFGEQTVDITSFQKGYDTAGGKYYTCGTMEGISNMASELKLSWSDNVEGEICEMDDINVKPYWAKGWEGYKAYVQNFAATRMGVGSPYEPDNLLCAKGEINTALGCIDASNPQAFVGSILTLAVAIGGATALALMLYGFFVITTSAGIPDKVNAGRDIITAAVSGLVFIILSVILMKIIGVDILNLPGLQ